MRVLLEKRNKALVEDLVVLLTALGQAPVPGELRPYQDRLVQLCRQFQGLAASNLSYLGVGDDDVLEEVLSNTRAATQVLRLLTSKLAIPVLRPAPSDRLSLAVIGWLHAEHPKTAHYPPAFADGACAIWPFFLEFAPIYFFPCMEQRGLLYQPLFFHEFGHLLYACHKPELDDLVGELQRRVEAVLLPASQRNDRHAEEEAGRRQVIVDTWYRWAQELFCDAVGFTIGGPSFLRAFSTFLSMMNPADFHRHPSDLNNSAHPVTWLRVRFLIKRASDAGFVDDARAVEEEWLTVAQSVGVKEDYHGFYDEALAQPITRAVEDMLIEVSPRRFTEVEANGAGWTRGVDSIVRLFNWAWQNYLGSPHEYASWEQQQIGLLLPATNIQG